MFQPARKVLTASAALAALGLGGAAIASAASSQTGPTGPTGSQSGSSSTRPPAFNGPAPGTAAHEDAEKAVTGATAAKVKAAAVKAVGGGTAGAVTTDYSQTGYETTVTKPDGSKVEVHLNSSFQVLQGPGGHGCPGGPHGAASSGAASSGAAPTGGPPNAVTPGA